MKPNKPTKVLVPIWHSIFESFGPAAFAPPIAPSDGVSVSPEAEVRLACDLADCAVRRPLLELSVEDLELLATLSASRCALRRDAHAVVRRVGTLPVGLVPP